MKKSYTLIFKLFTIGICFLMFFNSNSLFAAIRTSTTTGGDWAAPATWIGNIAPTVNDTVVIATTSVTGVTMLAAATCKGLTINAGAKLTVPNLQITVNGNTYISGTILFTGATGNKTFNGDITLNSGGIWNESIAGVTVFYSGNFENNATTFTANTGTHTFSGTNKILNGSTATIIPSVAVTGSYTNNGVLKVSTTLSGNSLTNGATGVLNIGGTITITTLVATTIGNSVNYYKNGIQTLKATTYHNLIISGASAKTFPAGTTTVNGTHSLEGSATATVTGTLSYGPNAALQYKGSVAQTIGNEFPLTFNGAGGVIIDNATGVNINSIRTITYDLLIKTGALATFTVGISVKNLTVLGTLKHNKIYTADPEAITVNGNLDITGTYDYTGFNPTCILMIGNSAKTIRNTNSSKPLNYLLLQDGDYTCNGNLYVAGQFWAMRYSASGGRSFNTSNYIVSHPTGTFYNDGGTVNINNGGNFSSVLMYNAQSTHGGTINVLTGGVLTTNLIYNGQVSIGNVNINGTLNTPSFFNGIAGGESVVTINSGGLLNATSNLFNGNLNPGKVIVNSGGQIITPELDNGHANTGTVICSGTISAPSYLNGTWWGGSITGNTTINSGGTITTTNFFNGHGVGEGVLTINAGGILNSTSAFFNSLVKKGTLSVSGTLSTTTFYNGYQWVGNVSTTINSGGTINVSGEFFNGSSVAGSSTSNGTLTLNTGATLNVGILYIGHVGAGTITCPPANTPQINITGSWMTGAISNNGTFTAGSSTVKFTGTSGQSILGYSPAAFYDIIVDKGSDYTSAGNTVEATGIGGGAISNTNNLTILNGLFKMTSGTFKFNSLPTIPTTGGIHVNGATLNGGNFNTINNGLIRISSGIANFGTATDNEVVIGSSPEATFEISGTGTTNISGRLQSSNSGNVTILGGTTNITTVGNSANSIGGFHIGANSSLTMNGGLVIFQKASTASMPADLYIINGTGIKSITGGTFQFGNASTTASQIFKINSSIDVYDVLVFGTNSPTAKLDAAITGSHNITINSNGILNSNNLNININGNWLNNGTYSYSTSNVTFNNSNDASLTDNSGSGFYNLTINKSIGKTLTIESNVSVNNDFVLSQGNYSFNWPYSMFVGRNWTQTGTSNLQFANGFGTVTFNGTASTISTTSTGSIGFGHLTIADNATLGSNIDVNGNLTINSLKSMSTSTSNFEISLAGNFTNNGTFITEAGAIIFDGTDNQQINGSTSTSFYNFTLNNAGILGTHNKITLSQPITVTHHFDPTAGILVTDATNILTMASGSTTSASAGSVNSFVDGPILKIGDSPFTFPTGDISGTDYVWAPVAIGDPGSDISDSFKAEYFFTSPTCISGVVDNPIVMCGNSIKKVSYKEYWMLNRVSGTSNPDVTLFWKDGARSQIDSLNGLLLSHWGSCEASGGDNKWTSMGALIGGNTSSGSITNSVTFASYSPLTLGIQASETTLPIEFISFTTTCNLGKSLLSWKTASEINNALFQIQRSEDGINWHSIGSVNGAGNSNSIIEYSFNDNEEIQGNRYYRLMQVDFDGAYSYSDVVVQNCSGEGSIKLISVTNEQNNESVTIKFSTSPEENFQFRLFDDIGQLVKLISGKTPTDGLIEIRIDSQELNKGYYLISMQNTKSSLSLKVLLK